MIVTVTMNPAIDKTVDIDGFEYGGLNRISHIERDAGGKGINVSKTIRELGGETIATGFIGGSTGCLIEQVLKELGIQTDFVRVEGETRTNTKLAEKNGTITELNEMGPVITDEAVHELLEKLKGYAKEGVWFVLAGSIPRGVNKDIYREIVTEVHKKGAKVFLDADGELFVKGLEAGPDIIKPNRAELEQYFSMDYRATEEELAGLGEKLLEKGIENVIVSMGQMGALFLSQKKRYKTPGLKVEVHSTVGAGDAMVASVVYGMEKGLETEEVIRLATAVSAGAVSTIGTKPPKLSLVEELKKQVVLQEL